MSEYKKGTLSGQFTATAARAITTETHEASHKPAAYKPA